MGDPPNRVTRYLVEIAIVVAILVVMTVVSARRGRRVLPVLGMATIAVVAGIATLALIGSAWGQLPPLGAENFQYCSGAPGGAIPPGCMRQGPLAEGWFVAALPAAAVVVGVVLVVEAGATALVLRRGRRRALAA